MHQAYQSNEWERCNLCYWGWAQGDPLMSECRCINPSFQQHGQCVSLCMAFLNKVKVLFLDFLLEGVLDYNCL